MAGKSKTGMEEMLGKLFGSPGMTETIDRIERVQAPQPPQPDASNSLPVLAPDSLSPASVDAQIGTDTGIQADTDTGIHTDTDIGIHTGTNISTHTGIEGGIHAGIEADIHTDIDSGLGAYPDTTKRINTGMSVGIHTNNSPDIHTGTLIGTLSGTHTDTDADTQDDMHPGTDTGLQLYMHIDPEIWYPFTENQGKVLLYLIEAGGRTNRNHIERDTGVPLSSVAKVMAMLEQRGYIKRAEHKHYEHRQRGFYYSVNGQTCSEFYERVRGRRLGTDTSIYTGTHTGTVPGAKVGAHIGIGTGMQVRTHTTQNSPFSSSRNELKPTTAEIPASDDLLRDPELGYWKEKGVNNRQLNAWSDEFQMPVEQVIQSLKYCRYDMVVLNQEEEKQISNPMNWFYKVMQRSGLYPKPAGYKSLAEIRAEQMEQAAREASEARERQATAERELAFQKIMDNPNSEEYRSLFVVVDDFTKELGGKALEAALREAFVAKR